MCQAQNPLSKKGDGWFNTHTNEPVLFVENALLRKSQAMFTPNQLRVN